MRGTLKNYNQVRVRGAHVRYSFHFQNITGALHFSVCKFAQSFLFCIKENSSNPKSKIIIPFELV